MKNAHTAKVFGMGMGDSLACLFGKINKMNNLNVKERKKGGECWKAILLVQTLMCNDIYTLLLYTVQQIFTYIAVQSFQYSCRT